MRFSERKGLKAVKSVMQVDSMDDDLRNALWNALMIFFWDTVVSEPTGYMYKSKSENTSIVALIYALWDDYFRLSLDTIPQYWKDTLPHIKKYFYTCKWHEVYDFIEFVASSHVSDRVNADFMNYCNHALKRDLSAYRFVGGKITQITSEEEIAAIEEALDGAKQLKPVHTHLGRSIELLSDRKAPDYRNSIKESISAVEAICILISGDEKATLGQALRIIESKIELHTALKRAFDNLYGYTSDADGIRHALLEESDLDFEDAKFMMVSCSAFINYLISKSAKAGVTIA